MIKIEKQGKKTVTEVSGYELELKEEIVCFLEFLEEFLPGWNLHSLKEDISKIDFETGGNKNDF